MPDGVRVKIEGAEELERNLRSFEAKLSRRAVYSGLRAARKAVRESMRQSGASKSRRVSKYMRFGGLSQGKYVAALTTVGVRQYGRATGLGPNQDQRAWFTAYSFEKGNPSPRNWPLKRGTKRRTQKAQPFMERSAELAFPGAVDAFVRKVKQSLAELE